MRWIPLLAVLIVRPAQADDVPDAMLRAFNEVARDAEAQLEAQGRGPAIRRYERGLEGELAGYGRIHLRLGQLYQLEGQMAPAAWHFGECDGDERVDPLDRELICQAGWRAVTAPVTLDGLPEGGKVLILEPELFSGPLHSGQRLPIGPVKVVTTAPGTPPREAVVQVVAPTTRVALGEEKAPPPPFVSVESKVFDRIEDSGSETWPAWVVGAAGVALVGAGVGVGVANQTELEDIRARQQGGRCPESCAGELRSAESTASLADGLWIGGAVVVVGGAVLWWLLAEDAP